MRLSDLHKALFHLPWIHRNILVWYLDLLFPADKGHLFRELLKTAHATFLQDSCMNVWSAQLLPLWFSSAVWCRHLLLIIDTACLWTIVRDYSILQGIAYIGIIILELVSSLCRGFLNVLCEELLFFNIKREVKFNSLFSRQKILKDSC